MNLEFLDVLTAKSQNLVLYLFYWSIPSERTHFTTNIQRNVERGHNYYTVSWSNIRDANEFMDGKRFKKKHHAIDRRLL